MRTASLGPMLFCAFVMQTGTLSAQTDTLRLAKEAAFIFRGEVLNATAARGMDLPPRGIVVRVLEVLYVKPTVAVRKGDLVVVQTVNPSLPSAGTRAVFYTNGWIYGRHLTVREVGQTAELTTSSAETKQQIAQAKAEGEDDAIRERLSDAALVVAGTVKSVRAFEEAQKRSPVSEHSADWWLAEVAVERTLKGEAPKSGLLIAFPTSRDVMWAESPKFKAGEQGVWILHRPKNLVGLFENSQGPVYTAIYRRDFQTTKDIERVVRLLRQPSPNPTARP
jgi:hypothetical protein